MQKHHTTIRIIFWLLSMLGSLVLGLLMAGANLSSAKQMIYIGYWLVFLMLGSIGINYLWLWQFGKAMDALRPLLSQPQGPDRYICEMQTMLRGRRSGWLRAVLLTNIAVGHLAKEDYAKGKALLLQVNHKRLLGSNQTIYWADLALAYFYLGEDTQAMQLLHARAPQFSALRNHTTFGGLLAILSVFEQLALGNRAAATQLLEQARQRWLDPLHDKDFAHLERLCRGDEAAPANPI